MSERMILPCQVRSGKGKNANRQLRAQEIIPAVYYTAGGESQPVQVEEAKLNRLYAKAGTTTVFDLEIDDNGKKSTHTCLVWDVEYYPTKNRFQHVDFYGVDMNKEIKRRVPLVLEGTSKGVKLGGKMEVFREYIDTMSKPAFIPKQIIVDISNLDVNQGLRLNDLIMPENVRPASDENFAILHVSAPGGAKEQGDENGA